MTTTDSSTSLRPLRIGDIELEHPFVQAALSGYSDWPMRSLARSYGASYTVAEVMIDRFANEVKRPNKTAHHFHIEDEDHPVGAQLMGSDPEMFVPAAQRLVAAGFDVIDINFGCPVKTAMGGCRGGYHLGQPKVALEIIKRVRDSVPDETPVTVKMRRGIDDTEESRHNFFHILEQAYASGVSVITVHGRTVEQKYRGPSNWDFLREVKQVAGKHIVLGSGDLFSADACVEMLKQTGVDGVTIARGAIGNPWIFRQATELLFEQKTPVPPTIHEQRSALEMHLRLSQRFHDKTALGTIRKFGFKYARLHPESDALKKAFGKLRSLDDWSALLDQFYTQDEPGQFPIVDEAQT